MMLSTSQKDLFTSVVSAIKSYAGDDPLRPWIQGIRKIRQSLPPHTLSEKLPRFLQKCAQTFESFRRYRNDSRYLAVWIQLMDYVEDAGVILRRMDKSQIGVKRAKFYIAYALYYEKKKRFEDAEKMYQLGVQKLSEPMGELQNSYDQFLHRMKLLKQRRPKAQEKMPKTGETTPRGCRVDKSLNQHQEFPNKDLDKSAQFCRDGTAMLKFVEPAIEGKSQAEDAYHHGMPDPSTHTKEDMDAISSSMFKEPLEAEAISSCVNQVKPKSKRHECSIEVTIDENSQGPRDGNHSIAIMGPISSEFVNSDSPKKRGKTELQKPFVGAFEILTDDEDDEDDNEGSDGDCTEIEEEMEASLQPPRPTSSDSSAEARMNNLDVRLKEDTVIKRLKEDTVIRKFMGSTVFEEPKVENACHHGLVDPTVNLKQAMDDINGMFGKPLNFIKTSKPKKRDKVVDNQPDSSCAFFILADDNMEKDMKSQAPPCVSHCLTGERDLFEPTLFTMEAMNEINDLFGKPLDF